MNVSLLDHVAERLCESVAGGDPLSLALAMWLHVHHGVALRGSPPSGLWAPRDVALAALLEASGKAGGRPFSEGLAALRSREFFVPHSPSVFEADPLAIFSVAVGIRLLADPQAAEWIAGIASRAAAGEADSWRAGLLAAVGVILGTTPHARLPLELDAALAAMGIRTISEDAAMKVLDACMALDDPPAERAAFRLAALRAVAVTSAGPSVGASPSRTPTASSATPNRVKILFMSANPKSTSQLAIDEELRGIQEKLRMAEHRAAFDMVVAPAVRHDDLEQALLEHKPVIVHFSGHGSGRNGLVFQGDTVADAQLVSADALGHLFSLLKKNVRVVVLNACYSEEQAAAIVQEIDFVVGMNDSIGDLAARKFAASFYRGLGFGETIKTAFGLGINALKREGLIADEAVPVLLVRQGVSPDVVLLSSP